jgi:protein-S-isoprenylcysteine O-methyltransferase Ste14
MKTSSKWALGAVVMVLATIIAIAALFNQLHLTWEMLVRVSSALGVGVVIGALILGVVACITNFLRARVRERDPKFYVTSGGR